MTNAEAIAALRKTSDEFRSMFAQRYCAQTRHAVSYESVQFRDFDEVLVPLQETLHGIVFNLRSASNIIGLTGSTGWQSINSVMFKHANLIADLDAAEKTPDNNDHWTYDEILAFQREMENAMVKFIEAREQIRAAAEQVATCSETFLHHILHRKFEVYRNAFMRRANHDSAYNGEMPADCYLCLARLAGTNVAWTVCCVPRPVCTDCFVKAAFESSKHGKQSFSTCSLCRSDVTFEDVRVANAP